MFNTPVLLFTFPQFLIAYTLFVGLQFALVLVTGLVKALLIRILG